MAASVYAADRFAEEPTEDPNWGGQSGMAHVIEHHHDDPRFLARYLRLRGNMVELLGPDGLGRFEREWPLATRAIRQCESQAASSLATASGAPKRGHWQRLPSPGG